LSEEEKAEGYLSIVRELLWPEGKACKGNFSQKFHLLFEFYFRVEEKHLKKKNL
jgi:hypothetical protein